MTFLLDPPSVFCTGSLLAFAARRHLVARSPNPFGPSAWAAVGHAALWWAAAQPMIWAAPDWFLAYFVPSESISMGFADAVFLVACLLSTLAGHTLTAVFLQRRHPLRAALVLLSAAFVLFGLWGLALDRYLHVGTHAAWSAGTAPLLPASPISQMIDVWGVVIALSWASLAATLYRAGRRLRAT